MNVLVVDNFDSFTYMLVDYLQQAGATCRVVRNNEPRSYLIDSSADAVVLSPGPGTPRQAGGLMNCIAYYYQRVPMLGICLGHQALGEFFGARLTTAARPMHGKVSTVRTVTDDRLWAGLPVEFDVTRYHSLILTDLPRVLNCLAATNHGEIMALRHQFLPLWGVQFHPEAALTQYGLRMIENWIDFVQFAHKKKTSPTSLTTHYL